MLLSTTKQPHGKSTRLALQARGLPLIYYKSIWYKLQGNIESEQIQELRRSKQRKSQFRGLSQPAAGAKTKSELFDKKTPLKSTISAGFWSE
ncbi:MAG: hypothetical protein RSE64_04970 [Oscillospiraceae bacterium]